MRTLYWIVSLAGWIAATVAAWYFISEITTNQVLHVVIPAIVSGVFMMIVVLGDINKAKKGDA